MYEVQHVRSDQLAPEIGCQVSSYIRLQWLTHLKGDDRFWVLIDPTGHVEHFYIAERGVLISHASVISRTIAHSGETYRLYGLGAVFTYPAFQREGYGQQVVTAATDYILRSDVDVGMLFCAPELAHFYAVSGWTAVNYPGIQSGDLDQPELDAGMFVMMLFVSAKAKAHRGDFEHGPIYVGEWTW